MAACRPMQSNQKKQSYYVTKELVSANILFTRLEKPAVS